MFQKAGCFNKQKLFFATGPRGGGGTSLWVRRGCAPVLGSFWPENSGIGVYCYAPILYKFSSNTWSVSGELISSIFVLKNVLRSEPRSNGHLEPKYSLPALNPLALKSNCFCYFFDWVSISDIYSGIGYQYRTKFLGLGRNKNPCGAHPRMNL